MKTAMHRACTTCAPTVHRFGVFALFVLVLAACTDGSNLRSDPLLIRNPTVPIGAIQRFDPVRFDGDWGVQATAGGPWALRGFTVSGRGTGWREDDGRSARMTLRATGILRLTYADETQRDLWVVWTDPDHNTLAVGTPDGSFGFIATRVGQARGDQITAARQVLDFNGYRTREWVWIAI